MDVSSGASNFKILVSHESVVWIERAGASSHHKSPHTSGLEVDLKRV